MTEETSPRRPVRRSQRRPGMKRWTPLFGLILVLIVIVGIPAAYTSRNTFCGSCHIMQPFYKTWRESTHAKVSCVSCHNGPGPIGLIAAKASLFRQVIVAVVFRPDKVGAEAPIPNSNCIACHAEHRKITTQEDLKLPAGHHSMKNNPFLCVDCHQQLVHDPTPNGKNVVKMKVCVDCHKAKKISTKCPTCHNNRK